MARSLNVPPGVSSLLDNVEWMGDQVSFGHTPRSIAERLGVSTAVVRTRLVGHQIINPFSDRIAEGAKQVLQSKDELEDLYVTQNKTAKEIADLLGVSDTTVRTCMNWHGVERREGKFHYTGDTSLVLDREWLADRVDEGLSDSEIASLTGLSNVAVCRHRNKFGIRAYNGLTCAQVKALANHQVIVDMYQLGRSVKSIADEFGVGAFHIEKVLDEADVVLREKPKVSNGETEIAEFIEQHVTCEVQRNVCPFGSRMELGIYIPDLSVGVEHNGIWWHTDRYKKNDSHFKKYEFYKQHGVQVIQIWEDQWLYQQDIVKRMLLSKLGVYDGLQYNARQCDVVELHPQESKRFLDMYHIQGSVNSGVKLGLRSCGDLVAVACFRVRGDGVWELTRYATSGLVRGGFSKLLKHFERNYNPVEVVTFADLMVSDGGLYERTGFDVDAVLRPDYQYVYRAQRFHKSNFRKNRFRQDPELFFEEGLSESELARANRIYRLWDAGKVRYTKKYGSVQ